jgi:hypothetical protein
MHDACAYTPHYYYITTGRRRVCIPPRVGWMCERRATLIKRDIILEREQLERQRIRQVLLLYTIYIQCCLVGAYQ